MSFSFKKHVLRNEIGVLLSKMLWLQLTAAQDICVQTDGHMPLQTVPAFSLHFSFGAL